MKSITDYFDELKAKTSSDYKSASILGMGRETLSSMRKRGQISDETAIKLAKALGKPEEELLIAAGYARASEEVKKVWEKISQRAGFASYILFLNQLFVQVIDSIECILC